MDETPSTTLFTSNSTLLEVVDKKYTLRVLKMNGSTLLFISNQTPELFDEMAIAMPMPGDKKEVVSTNVIGDHMSSNSYRLAEKLSKRFERQFIVSFNAHVDRVIENALEKALIDYIKDNKEKFA